MRTYKFILNYLLSGLLISSCTTNNDSLKDLTRYPKDTTISTEDGSPKDSLAFYYPNKFIGDTTLNQDTLDDFYQNWFSSSMYAFKEPILYNYYLGHDIYRFLWLRSFDRPIVIVLNRDKNNVWLNAKILDRKPRFMDQIVLKELPIKGKELKVELVTDSVIKGDRKAEIVFRIRLNLTMKEWNKVDILIKAADFWTIPSTKEAIGLDGSQRIIEAHTKEDYRFVQRWVPKDKFRQIGEYLIDLSGLKEEIY